MRQGEGGASARTGKEGRGKSRTRLKTDEGKHLNNTFISPATPDWLVAVAALLSHLSHGHQAMSAQQKYFINQIRREILDVPTESTDLSDAGIDNHRSAGSEGREGRETKVQKDDRAKSLRC